MWRLPPKSLKKGKHRFPVIWWDSGFCDPHLIPVKKNNTDDKKMNP